jgi:hypothetical protein
VRNNRHPRRQRRNAALMLAVLHDIGDHGVRGDLRDLREDRLFEVHRVLVIDENDAGATDDETHVGRVVIRSAACKVDVVLQFGDDKRFDEPEFIDQRL